MIPWQRQGNSPIPKNSKKQVSKIQWPWISLGKDKAAFAFQRLQRNLDVHFPTSPPLARKSLKCESCLVQFIARPSFLSTLYSLRKWFYLWNVKLSSFIPGKAKFFFQPWTPREKRFWVSLCHRWLSFSKKLIVEILHVYFEVGQRMAKLPAKREGLFCVYTLVTKCWLHAHKMSVQCC